jgi:large subunit ribosomal protein L25
MITLKAQKREQGSVFDDKKELRGIVYGSGVEENIMVMMDYNTFAKAYTTVGTSQIIDLDIEGESHEVLVKDFDLDPVSDNFRHVDFYAITRGVEIEVNVPFEFTGESPAVKSGNILNKVMNDISIKSLPRNIPTHIEIDLSVLETTADSIRLSDIILPEGVLFVTENLDDAIVSVSEPKEEVEETAEEVSIEGETEEKTETEGKKED